MGSVASAPTARQASPYLYCATILLPGNHPPLHSAMNFSRTRRIRHGSSASKLLEPLIPPPCRRDPSSGGEQEKGSVGKVPAQYQKKRGKLHYEEVSITPAGRLGIGCFYSTTGTGPRLRLCGHWCARILLSVLLRYRLLWVQLPVLLRILPPMVLAPSSLLSIWVLPSLASRASLGLTVSN
jgi:hypothetical protein